MPAIYAVDLIAKRDQKLKMDRSIVKGWNVHYETLEEVEAAARLKAEKEKAAQEAMDAASDEEQDLKQQASKKNGQGGADGLQQEAYNPKTRSYSGNYGKQPVQDESAKQQINSILGEKKAAFDAALSEIQAQV